MGCPEKDCCANNPGNDAISFPGTHGHDTPWKFYNHLIGHVPEDLVVRDYCLGTHWSYVEADCGMGISFTCKGGAKRKHTMDLRGLTLRAVAETGVDIVSIGALTHSVKALDISMKIR